MNFRLTYNDLNDMCKAIGTPLSLRYKGGYIEMVYDPGVLLPNIVFNLKYTSTQLNSLIYFDYSCEKGRFLFSCAKALDMLPDGIIVDDNWITIDINELNIIKIFRGKCKVRNFQCNYDGISGELYITE